MRLVFGRFGSVGHSDKAGISQYVPDLRAKLTFSIRKHGKARATIIAIIVATIVIVLMLRKR